VNGKNDSGVFSTAVNVVQVGFTHWITYVAFS
jgi:hypothetical protein